MPLLGGVVRRFRHFTQLLMGYLQSSYRFWCLTSLTRSSNSAANTLTVLWYERFEVQIPAWANDLPLTRLGTPSLLRNRFVALLIAVKAARVQGSLTSNFCCGWAELYLYSPCMPSWHVWRDFTFHFFKAEYTFHCIIRYTTHRILQLNDA
jgi:hypothetical protein